MSKLKAPTKTGPKVLDNLCWNHLLVSFLLVYRVIYKKKTEETC